MRALLSLILPNIVVETGGGGGGGGNALDTSPFEINPHVHS